MINQVSYDIETLEGPLHLTITPVNQVVPGGNYYATGVYRLTAGVVGYGDIIFDADMTDWQYNGIGELTYAEAAEVAEFIKNYKDPEGANLDLIQ